MITRDAIRSWEKVKGIISAALELKGAERAAYLDAECEGDAKMRLEIESLLAVEEEESADLFEEFADKAGVKSLAGLQNDSFSGMQTGAYRLTRKIGAGGMGVVYLGERTDGEFEQKVAVKLIWRGFDRDIILRKFRLERQILARLNHPNIAQLYDGGTSTEGLPYLVMEYVEGIPIDEYCREQNLSLEESLKLFRKICGAVSFAHHNLIVHRDLKPSNILVTADGEPKLLDFGIAKLLENEEPNNLTLTENRQLTPQYASPEQIRGETIGTASDVYSLGVILYELLTGQYPYRVKTSNPLDLARAIAEHEPVKPSSAAMEEVQSSKSKVQSLGTENPKSKIQNLKSLKGDLDNITLKALEKDISRRYASAEQLSEDVRRYLEGLPIRAQQNNWRYRSWKFVRRNRLAVSAAAAILLVLIGGIVATSYQTIAAHRERARAERRFNDVRKLSNSFLFEFHDAIKNLSGATEARKLVVSRALEYLNNLSEESSGDIGLQSELADAYRKLGEIQGHPAFSNVGDTSGAIESFQKARGIGEELVRRDPTNKDFRFKLADYNMMLGDMMERAVYNTPAALDYYRAALDLRRALISEDANNPDYLNALSHIYERVGNIEMKTGKINEAYNTYGESMKISEQLVALDANSRAYRRSNILSYYNLGNLLLADGKYFQAIETFDKGRSIAESIRRQNLADGDMRSLIGYFDDLMSKAYFALNDAPKASEHAYRALEMREESFAADPKNLQSAGDLTVSLDTVGEFEAANGKIPEGLAKLRRSLEMREAALRQAPAMTLARRFAAVSRNKIGKVLLRENNAEAALEEFRQALQTNQDLNAKDATNLDLSRELADSYANMSAALAGLARNAKDENEKLKFRTEAREMNQNAVRILLEMKENNTLFGADANRLEQLSRETARLEQLQ